MRWASAPTLAGAVAHERGFGLIELGVGRESVPQVADGLVCACLLGIAEQGCPHLLSPNSERCEASSGQTFGRPPNKSVWPISSSLQRPSISRFGTA